MQFDPIFLANYLDAIERQNMPRYAKGGKVVDLLAESLFGGKKATKAAPDTSRRKIMGLDPKAIEPGQVAVKETVSKAPKSGTTSVTLEEIANIPMSRRDVLRAGAGQMGRGLLPQGALRSMMELAGGDAPEAALEQMMQQSTKSAGMGLSTIPGVIAKALSMGLDEDQTLAMLKKMNVADELDVMYTLPVMNNPMDFAYNIGEEMGQLGPRQALGQMLGTGSGLDIRKALREVMRENPDLYAQLKEVARDVSDLSLED